MDKFNSFLTDIGNWIDKFILNNGIIGQVGNDLIDAKDITNTITGFSDIYDIISGVGLCLVALYLLISWIDIMTYSEGSMEKFVSLLLKAAIASFFVTQGFELLKYVVQFGDALLDTYLPAATEAVEATINEQTSYSIIEIISKLAMILPLYLCSLIVSLASKFITFTRFFEVNIHLLGSPIAFANMFDEGKRNAGMQYFKKFIALSLQGVIMAAIVISANEIMSDPSTITNMFSFLTTILVVTPGVGVVSVLEMSVATIIVETLKCAVIGFTVISLLFKSRSIAYDVVGV